MKQKIEEKNPTISRNFNRWYELCYAQVCRNLVNGWITHFFRGKSYLE